MKRIAGLNISTSGSIAALLLASTLLSQISRADCVTPPSGLVAWWRGESNTVDSAGSNNGIASSGLSYTGGEVGQAFSLNATNSNFYVPASASLNVGTGAGFTVEAWINPSNVNGIHPICEWNNDFDNPLPTTRHVGSIFCIGVTPSSLGVLSFYLIDTNGNAHPLASPSGTLVAGQWQHVAGTYDHTTGIATIYVNGVMVAQQNLGIFTPQTTYNLWVGHRPGDSPGDWTYNTVLGGPLDELSIYNRALSASDIAALFNAGSAGKCTSTTTTTCVAPPSGIVSWWRAEGNALDSIGTNNGYLTNGATFAAGEVGQAFSFNGVNQFVAVPRSASLNTFSNQLTIEFWMKANPSNSMSGFQGLVASDHYGVEISNGTFGNVGVNFYVDTGNGYYMISSANGGGIHVSPGVWHHIAGVYDGAKLQLYIDGTPAGNPVSASGVVLSMLSTSYLSIGSDDGRTYCGCSGRYFWGSIDEPAIYNRGLSSSEIAALYSAGAAGKCVPPTSTCVTPPSGIVSWWRAEGNTTDAIGSNNGVSDGNVTFAPGEVGQAFRLNDTNSDVRIPASASLNVGTNSTGLTLEAWISPSNTTTLHPIFEWNNGQSQGYGVQLYISQDAGPGSLYANVEDTSGGWHQFHSSVAPIKTNIFQHVALTYDKASGVAKLYCNGVIIGQQSLGSFTPQTSYDLYLGRRPADEHFSYTGLIDEAAIYNRALSSNEVASIYNAGSAGKCVAVAVAPTITTQPTSRTNTVGTTASFSVTATGTAPLSYQWRFNGTNIIGATSNVLVLPNVQLAGAGKYSVLVTNIVGSILSSNAILTVLPAGVPPSITMQPTSRTNLAGTTASFSITAAGTAPLSYQWRFNGTNITGIGATSNFLTLPNVQLANAGRYSVMVTNIAGSILSSNAILTVIVPPSITLQPGNLTNNAGTVATFQVVASGTAPLGYQWYFGSSPINGATNSSLSLYDVQPANDGTYSVLVGNVGGSIISSNGTLTVTEASCETAPSGIIGWWRAEGDATDTIGTNNGVLDGNVTFAVGEVGQAFQLNNTNSDVRIPASASLNIGTNGTGLTVEAWIAPSNTLGEQPIFEWNNGQSQGFGVHFYLTQDSGPGSLYANVEDSAGGWHQLHSSVAPVKANVFQHVALTYDKSSGVATLYCNGVIVGQQTVGSFTPQTSYDLYLGRRPADEHFSYSGLIDEASIYNRALSPAEIQAVYNAGSAGKCVPLYPPTITSQPTNLLVTAGDNATFTVTATGTAPLSYQWTFNSSPIAGATNSSLTLSNVDLSDEGTYAVTITNIIGSATSSNATLAVNLPPVADASATVPMAIAVNGSNAPVILNGSLSYDLDGDPLQYTWYANSNNVLATGVVAMVILPLGTNTVTLNVSDGLASSQDTITVQVLTVTQAIVQLEGTVTNASSALKPLLASLNAALASIDRSNPLSAINQLKAFQNKVQAMIAPLDPTLAQTLIDQAQAIIDSLSGSVITGPLLQTVTGHGNLRLRFSGTPYATYVVESSKDLKHWTPIGVAIDNGNGTFEFDDAPQQSQRFYRIVQP